MEAREGGIVEGAMEVRDSSLCQGSIINILLTSFSVIVI